MVLEDADDLRKVLSDIVIGAVLHPAHPDQFEIVPRVALDKARMFLDEEDVAKAATRARRRPSEKPRNR